MDWNFLPDETFDAFGFCGMGFATPDETFDTFASRLKRDEPGCKYQTATGSNPLL